MGALHVGTDGGGSIRIPASCAGIYGFKPSYGRIPLHPPSGAWSLSHIGPMTRTVADAALTMDVCAGPDERDPSSLPADGARYSRGLGLQGRARPARGHRRPRRLLLRLDPVHARVQPHGPARGVRAVRIHEGRIANRIANRGSPLRRHARAPRLRGLRARAAVAPAATVHRLTSPLRTEAAGTRRRLNRRLTYWTLTRAASPTTLPA